ncbi:MAG TPA: hypothetical protein VMV53_10950 [Acidimicrobiales bacterium]|nr:hypothetical protein [Acidimicrobiales bacterium]
MAFETASSSDSPSLRVSLPSEKQFARLVSSRKPFGLDTTFKGAEKPGRNGVLVYRNSGIGYIHRSEIEKGTDAIDCWKVFIPRAGSGSDSFPHPILGKPFVGEPGSASSETYMYIGPLDSEAEARNVITYISARLFRLLVLLHKPSQDATRSVYTFVPMQDFSHPWTDEMLYEKYGITEDEIAFIDKMIRPMDIADE